MDRPLLREQAPAEYFKELVDSALARQHIQAGDLTAYYLVNLLCQFVRPEARANDLDAEPLAFRLTRALQTGGSEQRARLRSLGDFSLFMSGFFSDSFGGGPSMSTTTCRWGNTRTDRSAVVMRTRFAEVFGELSRKFVGYHGRLGGYQRAHGHNLQCGLPPTVREMDAHRQLSRRQEADRPGDRPERLHGQAFHAVGLGVRICEQKRPDKPSPGLHIGTTIAGAQNVTFQGQTNRQPGVWRLNVQQRRRAAGNGAMGL